MKTIVIFRTNNRFNMVTRKKWKRFSFQFEEEVRETARIRSISEITYSQFINLTHRKEVQDYLREVWHG